MNLDLLHQTNIMCEMYKFKQAVTSSVIVQENYRFTGIELQENFWHNSAFLWCPLINIGPTKSPKKSEVGKYG